MSDLMMGQVKANSQDNTQLNSNYSRLLPLFVVVGAISLWFIATILFSISGERYTESDISEKDTPQIAHQAVYDNERILRFSYELTNTQATAVKEAIFSSYLPVAVGSSQKLDLLSTTSRHQTQTGDLGNHVAHFSLGTIAPYAKKTVSFVAKVKTSKSPQSIDLNNISQYLQADTFIEVEHPSIIKLSQQLKGSNDRESLQRIYRWLSTRVKYAGYIPKDRGALYAITHLQGDCTEYMYAAVALARALGIPARGVGGYVYDRNQVVKPADYHNWAEVYIDGAWQVLDAQKKVFMSQNENYIAMRYLSDASASLLGSSHRFSVADKSLSIRMN